MCDPKSGNTILLHIIFGTIKTGAHIRVCHLETGECIKTFYLLHHKYGQKKNRN